MNIIILVVQDWLTDDFQLGLSMYAYLGKTQNTATAKRMFQQKYFQLIWGNCKPLENEKF